MRSYGILERIKSSLSALVSGFWLAVLSRDQMNSITEATYGKVDFYRTDEYNRRGLYDWERKAMQEHFSGCRSILVAGTGGGREVLALRRLGWEADGFESHPEFVRFANQLLEREGLEPNVRLAPWDGSPGYDRRYDGVVVGWGVYMHIRGRGRRVRFLKSLRERLDTGGPLLLSFFAAPVENRTLRLTAKVGNVVGRTLRRERVELGDSMGPDYVHYFSRQELEREMAEAGFFMRAYESYEHPHAVGEAV
jgi:hypothetical protein